MTFSQVKVSVAIARDVVSYIDTHYRTMASVRATRAIPLKGRRLSASSLGNAAVCCAAGRSRVAQYVDHRLERGVRLPLAIPQQRMVDASAAQPRVSVTQSPKRDR